VQRSSVENNVWNLGVSVSSAYYCQIYFSHVNLLFYRKPVIE